MASGFACTTDAFGPMRVFAALAIRELSNTFPRLAGWPDGNFPSSGVRRAFSEAQGPEVRLVLRDFAARRNRSDLYGFLFANQAPWFKRRKRLPASEYPWPANLPGTLAWNPVAHCIYPARGPTLCSRGHRDGDRGCRLALCSPLRSTGTKAFYLFRCDSVCRLSCTAACRRSWRTMGAHDGRRALHSLLLLPDAGFPGGADMAGSSAAGPRSALRGPCDPVAASGGDFPRLVLPAVCGSRLSGLCRSLQAIHSRN